MDLDDMKDAQRWNRYSYSGNNPLARIDPDGRRWFYTQDDKGNVTDIQWVNPNADGSYTSPGDGWKEFIPTKDKSSLEVFTPDRSAVNYLGENSDGSPKARWLWAGGVNILPTQKFLEILALMKPAIKAVQLSTVPPDYLDMRRIQGKQLYRILNECGWHVLLDTPANDYGQMMSPKREVLERAIEIMRALER